VNTNTNNIIISTPGKISTVNLSLFSEHGLAEISQPVNQLDIKIHLILFFLITVMGKHCVSSFIGNVDCGIFQNAKIKLLQRLSLKRDLKVIFIL